MKIFTIEQRNMNQYAEQMLKNDTFSLADEPAGTEKS